VTVDIREVSNCDKGESVIVVIPREVDFDDSSRIINHAVNNGIFINGAIVQRDDGVLINNRLVKKFRLLMKFR
jgi:hypothetical protein